MFTLQVLQRLGLSKDVQLSKEVELAVIELAENMLDHTMEFACLMASRRGGKWLEVRCLRGAESLQQLLGGYFSAVTGARMPTACHLHVSTR